MILRAPAPLAAAPFSPSISAHSSIHGIHPFILQPVRSMPLLSRLFSLPWPYSILFPEPIWPSLHSPFSELSLVGNSSIGGRETALEKKSARKDRGNTHKTCECTRINPGKIPVANLRLLLLDRLGRSPWVLRIEIPRFLISMLYYKRGLKESHKNGWEKPINEFLLQITEINLELNCLAYCAINESKSN